MLNLLQVELEHDSLHLSQLAIEGIGELLFAGMQSAISQSSQLDRVIDALDQRIQHASPTLAQNVAHHRGELDLRLFEQSLDLIPQPH